MQMAMDRGLLRRASARAAAVHFVGLIRGDLCARSFLGMVDDITPQERRSANKLGVDAFMRVYQIEPND